MGQCTARHGSLDYLGPSYSGGWPFAELTIALLESGPDNVFLHWWSAESLLLPTIVSFGIVFLMPTLVWIANLALCILAAVKANNGQYYHYPFTLRLIK